MSTANPYNDSEETCSTAEVIGEIHRSVLAVVTTIVALASLLTVTNVRAAPPSEAAQGSEDASELDIWEQTDEEDEDGSAMELHIGPRFPLGLTGGVRGFVGDTFFAQADLGAMVMFSYAVSYRGALGATLYRSESIIWDIWGGGMGFVSLAEPEIDGFDEALLRFLAGTLLGEGRTLILPPQERVQPFWVAFGTGLTWHAWQETSLHFDIGAMALTNERYDFDVIDVFSSDSFQPDARPLVPTVSLGLVYEL